MCREIYDVAFILDGSGSVSRANFRHLKQFTKDAVTALNVSGEGSHVAIIEYSDQPELISGFDTFTGTEWTQANLDDKIDGMKQSGGHTFINRAIQFANDEVFREDKGMRPDVKQVSMTRCRRATVPW